MKGADLLAKQKFWIIGAVLVLVIALLLYWWGKRSARSAIVSGSLPPSITQDGSATELATAESYASRLYGDMKGINWLGHDADLWRDFAHVSDRILVLTNNVFNAKYGGGETLYQWLKGEAMSSIGDSGTALKRMAGLDLY